MSALGSAYLHYRFFKTPPYQNGAVIATAAFWLNDRKTLNQYGDEIDRRNLTFSETLGIELSASQSVKAEVEKLIGDPSKLTRADGTRGLAAMEELLDGDYGLTDAQRTKLEKIRSDLDAGLAKAKEEE